LLPTSRRYSFEAFQQADGAPPAVLHGGTGLACQLAEKLLGLGGEIISLVSN